MSANYDNATARLKALAHPTRLQILDMLRRSEEVCVCHMETALHKRQAYISQQLIVLRDVGIVEARKDGLQVFYRLIDDIAADILEVVLGPVDSETQKVLENCACPTCTAFVASDSIPIRR